MLQIEDLHGGYDRVAVLNGVRVIVQDREIVALLGRNGMGKTTLLRAILGLVQTTKGNIRFNDREISRLPAYARSRLGIGYVPQGRLVFPRLTVRENLEVAAFASGQPMSRVAQLLESFPFLGEKATANAASLSGGQQQLLAIARALATGPRLLLLDEPSEGIQPSLVMEILSRVRRVNQEFGISVLLVEQNLEFATSLASRVYIMDKGQVAAEMSPGELLDNKRYQHELLGV